MKVEIATLNDIDKLCDLLTTLFEQEVEFKADKKIQKKALTMIVKNPVQGHILIARDGDNIVGMLTLLYSISTALGSKVAVLEDMIISKEHQSRGIGTLLVLYAKSFAKENECKRITLLTDFDNIKAHKFYEINGFTKSTMIPFRIVL